MSDDQATAAETPITFESLSDLRAEHIELMGVVRRNGRDEDQVRRIHEFIDRVKLAGKWLDSPVDRDTAQNIITYWASHLFSAGDREALSATLPVLEPFDPTKGPDLSNVANPYLGLSPFGEDDAGRFFGREEAVKTLLDKLRDQPAVLVVGPMGSGKTSIVTAGVVPRLKSRFPVEGKNSVVLVVLPGADPFAALLRSIHEAAAQSALPRLGMWISEQRDNLESSPEHLSVLLEAVCPGRPVIIVVDQFEQVFIPSIEPKVRERFAQALIGVCPNSQSPNRTILIIDAQYEQRALQLTVLKPLAENRSARFFVPPLTAAEAQRVIESAAATVGLRFDEGIVEDLAAEVAGDARALPTLQFTLSKLWNERERNRITWDAYRKVGKPRDALKRTADTVFGGLSSDEQKVAEKLLLELVQPTTGGNFIRRRVRRDVLAQIDTQDKVARVLERFVEAGLIRQTAGVGWDDDRFDVPHEALVDTWPRLRDWLQRERDESKKKLQLVEAARLWQESGFKEGYLLSDSALDEAANYTEAASELKELVAASREYARRQSRRSVRIRNTVMFAMAILLAAAVAGALMAWSESQSAQRSADIALGAVRRVHSKVSEQVNDGAISTKAATELLKTAEGILVSVEPRPQLTKSRADLLTKFSDVYLLIGDGNQALAQAEQAKALAEPFARNNPDDDDWQALLYASAFRIGDLLESSDPKRAAQEFSLAVEIARKRAATHSYDGARQQNIAFIENKIGDIFLVEEEWDQSLKRYRSALAIGEQLVARQPKEPEWQKVMGDAHQRIGFLFAKQKLWQAALAELQDALGIQEALVRSYPESDIYRGNLSASCDFIGDVYKDDSKPEDALRYYEKSFDIREQLAGKDPDITNRQRDLAHEYTAIADVLARQDPTRAIENYRAATTIRARLATKDPGNVAWARDAANAHDKLAEFLVLQRRFDDALKEYDAALEVRGQLARQYPDDRNRQRELGAGYERVGDAFKAQGDSRKALEAYQKGLAAIEAFMLKDPGSGMEQARAGLQEKIQSLAPNVQPR